MLARLVSSETAFGFDPSRERFSGGGGGLLTSPVWLGVGTPRGYGRPVLLIPGFGASDGSLVLLARWLRLRGYRTYRARIGWNVGCSQKLCGRLERRPDQIAADRGDRVALVGHSRGGILTKALASARPDLVAGIVTWGSPTVASRGQSVGLEAAVVAAMVRPGHLPNLLSWGCATGSFAPRKIRTPSLTRAVRQMQAVSRRLRQSDDVRTSPRSDRPNKASQGNRAAEHRQKKSANS